MPLNLSEMSFPLTGFWEISTRRQRPGIGLAWTSWMFDSRCRFPWSSKSRFWSIVETSLFGCTSAAWIAACGSFEVAKLTFNVRVDEGTSNS